MITHLGVENEETTPSAKLGRKGRLDAICMRGDSEAQGLEKRDEGIVGFVLLICKLWCKS